MSIREIEIISLPVVPQIGHIKLKIRIKRQETAGLIDVYD